MISWCARLQRTCGIQSRAWSGAVPAVGELAGDNTGQPHQPTTIVACVARRGATPAQAVHWNGQNRQDVEAVTGRCVADSISSATTILVDAWGTPQICEEGWWVVVRARGPILVLAPERFSARYTVVRPRRTVQQEAA